MHKAQDGTGQLARARYYASSGGDYASPGGAYASKASASRGRLFEEPASPMRGVFQRDRDRIIHSTAFRRLTYKTQVFLYHEGDHYRTRLTHTLEVAQIARTIARLLGLDEDLAEAIALGHDLGHPPFGHAGERTLDRMMAAHGGFDHNAQSLRVVTALEHKYADFDGLNLTWETLEGLVKHNGPLVPPDPAPGEADSAPGKEDANPVHPAILAYDRRHRLDLASQPSAEAQVAAIADDIAYNNHDMDDGLRAGLINFSDLGRVPLAARFIAEVEARHSALDRPRKIYEVNRRLITFMVDDVRAEARRRIEKLAPESVSDIRSAPAAVVAFSAEMQRALGVLRRFLFQRVYRHARVMRVMAGAETIVSDLFGHYTDTPEDLPKRWRAAALSGDEAERALVMCDFVAGMTDRYAIERHRHLFDATPDLS